jgi:hypothetical protein
VNRTTQSISRPPRVGPPPPRRAPRALRRAATLAAGLALFAVAVAGLAGGTALAAGPQYSPSGSPTDPVNLQPPQVTVLQNQHHLAPGLIFIGPKAAPGTTSLSGQQGAEIADNQGRPVWFNPVQAPDSVTDVRVQQYHGKPVLTYGIGHSTGGPGHSEGYDVILNNHYQQIATVQAGNGLAADQHEFALTPQGTALITIYHQVPYDLSSVGGPTNGQVLDGVIQEIDVATGKVLFQWDSLSHVPLSDSYVPAPTDPATPYDYFHINSVNLDTDGNLLVSARHTWTVYKLNHQTGDIIWRLGGKHSDFQLGPGVATAWQHNALPEAGHPNTIRIFDNHSNGAAGSPPSRIIDVHLNTQAKTANLVGEVEHPDGLSAGSQGNAQRLPDGHLFVGWGQLGRFSEFDSNGNLLFDAKVPDGYDTYRAYRSPWVGEPLTRPTAVAARAGKHEASVEAIWNGATEVDRWVVLSGRHPWSLHPTATGRWNGLDTTISAHTDDPIVEVVALNDSGRAIGRSQAVHVND